MAFQWAYSLDGSDPILQTFTAKDGEVFSAGELVHLASGEAVAATTNQSTYIGIATEGVDNSNDGQTVRVIMNPGAVYSVTDGNLRVTGATLDVATGGLGVAASSNADLIVVRGSSASEPTYVTFNGTHYLQN
jgi:hypothetical protein